MSLPLDIDKSTYCVVKWLSDHGIRKQSSEDFEDTKGVIRIRISKKKNRQHNGPKKYKRTNNDQQNIMHKIKDRVPRTPLKHGVDSGPVKIEISK